MSDVAKWAIRAALIVAILAVFLSMFDWSNISSGLSSVATTISQFLSAFSSQLVGWRKVINNLFIPQLVTIQLICWAVAPIYDYVVGSTRDAVDSIQGD